VLDFSVTFIITIINIAVLFFVLKAILWKPVSKFMADRTRKIEESIEQSEKDRNQAKALLAQYEAQLKNAETEAESIINAAKEQARLEAEKIIAESRMAAEAALATSRRQLESERGAAMAAFKQEAAALVVAAAGRLVERNLDSEDSRQYAFMLFGPGGQK
jgi:F-type H+-transporting ATPase subunit b